jgi:hypothetical protein
VDLIMETLPIEKRAGLAIKRLASILVSRARRVFGSLVELVLHDQLGDISRQTQRLGSASVESSNYVGGELRALDERLAKIEEELAALRGQLAQGQSSSDETLVEDITSGPRSS